MSKLLKPLLVFAFVGTSVLYGTDVSALVERQIFEVSVSIPTNDFHVLPVDPQLLTRQQVLEWDASRGGLRPLVANFDVRNSAGAVRAYLDAAPVMSNGSNTFGLTVRFNGKALAPKAVSAVEVLSERAGNSGARVSMEVVPERPEGGYLPGTYYGNVRMIFDAVAPTNR
jgi:hypothetical protein